MKVQMQVHFQVQVNLQMQVKVQAHVHFSVKSITYEFFPSSPPSTGPPVPPIGQGRIRKVSQLQQLFLQKIVTCVYCAKSIQVFLMKQL